MHISLVCDSFIVSLTGSCVVLRFIHTYDINMVLHLENGVAHFFPVQNVQTGIENVRFYITS